MKNDLAQLEEAAKKAEKRAKKRERKKRPKMKVSGRSVFRLREMMQKRKS